MSNMLNILLAIKYLSTTCFCIFCVATDYNVVSVMVTLSASRTETCFNITALEDGVADDGESFGVRCTGQRDRDRVTIDPDTATIVIFDVDRKS